MAFTVVWLDGPGGPEGIEEAVLAKVGARLTREGSLDEPLRQLAEADAILCDATRITPDLLDRAPRVQIISEYGIGYDNIDVGAASQRGVWVANVPGFCAEEVADHAIALVMAGARRVVELDRSARAGAWDPIGVAGGMQRLGTQTIGIVGLGAIGRLVAKRAAAFGLRILAWSPRLTAETAREHGAELVDLDRLLRESDFVSLHVPGGPATYHLLDAAALARMKPTARLINTARGSVVDEAALLAALRSGQLAGAALDVRENEPAGPEDPFLALPNVILTPHAGYYSQQSLVELRRRAAENVAAVLAGGPPPSPVNPHLLPRKDRAAAEKDLWV